MMINFVRETFSAWDQRIRTPILGSIILVFVAWNWKPLVYLVFSDKPLEDRFAFFDASTSGISPYLAPIILGAILSVLLPWLKLVGANLAKAPSKRLKSLQHDEAQAHRIYQFEKSAEEEEAKAKLEDAVERRKIEAAKRLEEAKNIGSGELEREIVADRDEKEEKSFGNLSKSKVRNELKKLTALDKEVLLQMNQSNHLEINEAWIFANEDLASAVEKRSPNFSEPRFVVDTGASLEKLSNMKLVLIHNNYDKPKYSLTSLGFLVVDAILEERAPF